MSLGVLKPAHTVEANKIDGHVAAVVSDTKAEDYERTKRLLEQLDLQNGTLTADQ